MTRLGVMCPLCYCTEYADDTGLDELLTAPDLLWLNSWSVSEHGPICRTCAAIRDYQEAHSEQ
jgi:hypothetical protein